MLLQFICSYLQNQCGTHRTTLLRTRTRRQPSGQLGPTDLSCERLVVLVYWTYYTYQTIFYVMDLLCIELVIYVMDYSMYWTIFCVSDLLYVSDSCYVLDLWYMWWTCVICIDATLVIVNYIFVIITACNDPCIYIYFCYASSIYMFLFAESVVECIERPSSRPELADDPVANLAPQTWAVSAL